MTRLTQEQRPIPIMDEPEMSFGEPWQAEAFATALQLSHGGLYSWTEWVQAFSAIIREQPQRADESIGDAYYRQWLAALERLLAHKAVLREEDVTTRQALWHLAYLHTPHGQPVSLNQVEQIADPCAALERASLTPAPHAHHHHHHAQGPAAPTPIAVSPGRAATR
ncbi:nitrile hydratase accessory protein [Sodalis sp. RH16]|jgi:nitrile hydratase accessory protein|uniref:nitrile hydratase accessory protein n=1 Tax=Sodalis sp. RH16 TaxID=3394331 RepID=UPI0039B5ABA6